MSIILPLLVIIVPLIAGTVIFAALNIFKEKLLVLAAGGITGLSLFTALLYLSTSMIRLRGSGVLLAIILLIGLIFLLFAYSPARCNWKKMYLDKTGLTVLAVLLVSFGLITPNLLIDLTDSSGGIQTGVINSYGDMGFHMATITLLAEGAKFIPEDPILAGEQLTYPFLSNFLSAIMLKVGGSYTQIVVLPSYVLIVLTLLLFYCLGREITNNKKVAVLALILFTLGGGTVGWIRIIDDLDSSGLSFFEFLTSLPKNYSGHSVDGDGINVINPIISLLLPQRAFLFGMPMAFIIILLLAYSTSYKNVAFIIAGILSGLLPFYHAHTVIALVPVILLLIYRQPNKRWVHYLAMTAIVGLPSVIYYLTSSASSSAAPHIQLGWMSKEDGFIRFWLKNTGLLLPVTLWAMIKPATRDLKLLALAGLFLFVIANIWLFAAWEWDNTKLFAYWILFTLPLVAWFVATQWRKNIIWVKTAIVATVVFHIISGTVDLVHLALPNGPTWMEWSNEGIKFAELIKKNTPADAVIVSAPIHNSPIDLTGRPMYLGFPGHVWTHGGNHWAREEAVPKFYRGEIEILPEVQPAYAIVGPEERSMFYDLAISPFWEVVASTVEYTLYKIPQEGLKDEVQAPPV